MQNEAFKEWYTAGLQALMSASEVGKRLAERLLGYVTSPELRAGIEEGRRASARHAETISNLLKDAGAEPQSMPNEIMEAIDSAADKIADSEDKDVRDAGVITTAQIALHYHIAAYGGLAATAKHLGMTEQAEQFSAMCNEAKQADEAYTQMAERRINQKAKAA